MSQKYTGGFITKSPVAPTTTAASGVWTLDQQQQYQKAGTWPAPPIFIEDLFSTYLYTGNSSTQTITNGIDLSGKGGLTWIKVRDFTYNHYLYDTARGVSDALFSNSTSAQSSSSNFSSFDSSGFTLNSSGGLNNSSYTYASWTFREQPKFFDIVTYTGDGTNGRAISHSLGSVPGCILVKCTSASQAWRVYHRSLPTDYNLELNATDGAFSDGNVTSPTSTTFTVNNYGAANTNGNTYVAYLFAHNAGGFPASGSGSTNGITCGSWTGTGSTFNVDLGYEPQWLMFKRTDDLGDWVIVDNMRGFTTTGADAYLKPNTNGAETSVTGAPAVNATGFSWNTSAGSNFIYIAIRRGPMKTPTVGTSVFSPNTTSDDGNAITTGFPVDMFIEGLRAGNAINQALMDRLRGNGFVLTTSSTAVENPVGEGGFASNTTIKPGLFGGGSPAIVWNFRRAPSFFDEVCYTGTGSARTITHNLGAVPELMIVKRRDAAANWPVYTASTATNEYLFLNSGGLPTTATTVWNNTAPTSSVFSVGTSALTNASAGTYVAYLFSSCAGVSKVGSYTGTGALQTINCGFTSGARFVLIKLISSGTSGSGDWYVWDSARGISSGNDPYLLLDSTSAEVTGTNYVDTDTTGFKVTAAGATDINASGDIYLFLAIA